MLQYYNEKLISLLKENPNSFSNDIKNKFHHYLNKLRYLDIDETEVLKVKQVYELGAVFDKKTNKKMFYVPEDLNKDLFKKYRFRTVKRKNKISLNFPPKESLWSKEYKTIFKPSELNLIKNKTFDLQKNRCFYCDDDNRHQIGEFKKTTELATGILSFVEEWSYDFENQIQKLEGFKGVCRKCFLALKMNELEGDLLNIAQEQMIWLNKIESKDDLEKMMQVAIMNYKNKESVGDWKLNVSYLKTEEYFQYISEDTIKKIWEHRKIFY